MVLLGADHFAPPTWLTSLCVAASWSAAPTPLNSHDSGSRSIWARLPNSRAAPLVELVTVLALLAGLLWLARAYSWTGDFARTLLSPRLWLLVLLVSGFGTAGSLGPYHIGRRGKHKVFARFPRLEGERWDRVESAFRRRGASLLVLSGIPTLGLVLATAAGAFGIEQSAFIRWVMLSKVIRNWLFVLASYLGLLLVEGAPQV